jgi:hypothetical protein
MEIILILISLFVYFVIGGYVSQRCKSMMELPMVVLWPAYLAGLLGRLYRANECAKTARKLKRTR